MSTVPSASSESALENLPPICPGPEVVHNRYVVNKLKDAGAVFVEELDEVPDDSIVIFSAHGVAKNGARDGQVPVPPQGVRCHLSAGDCWCTWRFIAPATRGCPEAMLIGHAGHPEMIGTMGSTENREGGMCLVETPGGRGQAQGEEPG